MRTLPILLSLLLATGCRSDATILLGTAAGEFRHSAERQEERLLSFAEGSAELVVEGGNALAVEATREGPYSLVAVWQAPGRTAEEAEAVLERYRLDVTEDGGTIRVRAIGEPLRVPDAGGTALGAALDLRVLVPVGTKVSVTDAGGSLRLAGELGDAKLQSQFGAIHVTGLRGSLAARTAAGSVEALDVSGPVVSIESSFGRITAEHVVADRIDLASASGSVHLASARAGATAIDAQFGAVQVRALEGDLVVRTASGSIRVERLVGALQAHTGFGSVTVDGVLHGARVSSGSGAVSVHAEPGSRVEQDWRLASDFGKVRLAVADDFAGRFDASTSFGHVRWSLATPLEDIEVGGNSLRGTLGQGAGKVVLRSGAGGIDVAELGG